MENEEQVPIYWALASLGPQVSPQNGTQVIFPETPIPSLMSPGHIRPWWSDVTPGFVPPIKAKERPTMETERAPGSHTDSSSNPRVNSGTTYSTHPSFDFFLGL